MDWIKSIASSGSSSSKAFGTPEEWEFDYDWARVKVALWVFILSGFKVLLTQDEAGRYDPRWVDDIKLGLTFYSFVTNDHPIVRMLDEALAFKKDPISYENMKKARELAEQYDGYGDDGSKPKPKVNSRYRR